ncbi:MAG TPA: HIRAN domain-containing protein [Pseudogracilibacillus sp.]|nr:HIRAN domain-containing protein [Pseudogracilibacillus sp.]
MYPKTYATVVGMNFHDVKYKPKVDDSVILLKDPKNEYDDEAIAVFTVHKEKLGYVANSTRTVAKGTYSAGRLYDKFDHYVVGVVQFILRNEAIVEVMLEDAQYTIFGEFYIELPDR